MDQKLFDIVLRAIKEEGAKSVADTIQLAHIRLQLRVHTRQ